MNNKKEQPKKTRKNKTKKVEVVEDIIVNEEEINKDNVLKRISKNSFNSIEVVVIMVITALFGALIGSGVTYFRDNGGIRIYNKDLRELISTYHDVVDNYYGDIDSDELLESGIKGMMEYLNDPYSSYLDSEASEEFNEKIEGEYIGLGAEIAYNSKEKTITINTIFEDSPAAKSGLKVGDLILKIEDKGIKDLSLNEITAIIKGGEKGSIVKLDIKRGEEELSIEFKRGTVELTSVEGRIIEKDGKKVGVIKIDIFAKNSYKQFKKVEAELEKEGATSLIIDVRNNTGGYLTTVKSIAEMFLDKKDVMFIVKDKKTEEKQLASKNKEIDLPVAILINGGSASASEILAAALNENLGTELVGLKTYGKGSVQKTKVLSSGATIKYTTQKWLTPTGNSIDGKGINPTIEVEQNEKYYDTRTDEDDAQLQKAIETVLKGKSQ